MIALFIIDHIQHYHPFVWSSATAVVAGSNDVGRKCAVYPPFGLRCIGMVFWAAFSGAPEWRQGLRQMTLTAFRFAGSAILLRPLVAPRNFQEAVKGD